MTRLLTTSFAYLLAAAALGVSADTAAAQQARAYVSSDSITVGDRFSLILIVPRDETQQIARPVFPTRQGESVVRFGDLIVLKSLSSGLQAQPPGSDFAFADSLVYEATTFAIDTARVPPLRLHLIASGDTTTVSTGRFQFPVVSLLNDEREDIQDVTEASGFPPALWPWLVLLLCALAGYLGYRFRDRLKRPEDLELEEDEPEIIERDPPLEEALGRLLALEASDISNEQAIKPFFVDLADIIRTYMTRRIRIPALETTTRELLRDLKEWTTSVDSDADLAGHLQDILETVDLAKFAASRPAEEWCRGALSETRELILQVEDIATDAELKAEEERLAAEALAAREAEMTDNEDPKPSSTPDGEQLQHADSDESNENLNGIERAH